MDVLFRQDDAIERKQVELELRRFNLKRSECEKKFKSRQVEVPKRQNLNLINYSNPYLIGSIKESRRLKVPLYEPLEDKIDRLRLKISCQQEYKRDLDRLVLIRKRGISDSGAKAYYLKNSRRKVKRNNASLWNRKGNF